MKITYLTLSLIKGYFLNFTLEAKGENAEETAANGEKKSEEKDKNGPKAAKNGKKMKKSPEKTLETNNGIENGDAETIVPKKKFNEKKKNRVIKDKKKYFKTKSSKKSKK